jgi:hypothetical protein
MDAKEELIAIARKNDGVLRPIDVVEYARDKNTALHSSFEWDDNKAAEEYRLWQAREIIRVTVTMLPNVESPVKVFVSLNEDRKENGGGYRFLADVMTNTAQRNLFLKEAFAEFKRWELKYKTLKELTPLFIMAEKIEKKKLAR